MNDNSERRARIPATWKLRVTNDYTGVVIVFDEGNPLYEQAFGMSAKAARELGKGLIAQAHYSSSHHKPKIVKPSHVDD